MIRTPVYPTSRRLDAESRIRQGLLGESSAFANLGSVASGQSVETVSTHSWSTSYATGGEDVTLPSLSGTVHVSALARKGYTFDYDSGTGKLLAYDGPGSEVSAATNLSAALGTTVIVQRGSQTQARTIFVAKGDVVVTRIRFMVGEAVSTSSTAFWGVAATRRSPESNPIAINSVSGGQRAFGALEWVDVYAGLTGLALKAGDMIQVALSETGTPAALVDLTFETCYRMNGVL